MGAEQEQLYKAYSAVVRLVASLERVLAATKQKVAFFQEQTRTGEQPPTEGPLELAPFTESALLLLKDGCAVLGVDAGNLGPFQPLLCQAEQAKQAKQQGRGSGVPAGIPMRGSEGDGG
jgi:hypothetical protein